jgi:hypothetical protein
VSDIQGLSVGQLELRNVDEILRIPLVIVLAGLLVISAMISVR